MIQPLNGLVNGMILALVASGLTLIFGIMDATSARIIRSEEHTSELQSP